MPPEPSLTPLRRQYLELKARYPGAVLFFRMGDFYETFDSDAELVAKELEITLTSRPIGKGERVPLAGVPYHAVEGYLAKLVRKGYRVAICEQQADPKQVKGIVPRDVTRVVTPGTVIEPQLLESKRNNYLAAIAPTGAAGFGIAYIDITTSEFGTTQVPEEEALAELERLGPAEVLVPKQWEEPPGLPGSVMAVDDLWFEPRRAAELLRDHFGVATLEGFGCQALPGATAAAGAVLRYLQDTQAGALPQVSRLFTYSTNAWMPLDTQTKRNLELFQRARSGASEGSLLSVLDLTVTPMGGRLLRRWLERPLIELEPLLRRLDAVEALTGDTILRSSLASLLKSLPDLERLVNRVRSNHGTPRELISLRSGLQALPQLRELLDGTGETSPLVAFSTGWHPCPEVRSLLEAAIAEDAPTSLDQGGVIRSGFSAELDGLRERFSKAQEAILGLEKVEQERTGIKSLKVGYNKVFGYYIEVSNAHRRRVPLDYHRKQTLVGAERYFTPELKDWETTVLQAQEGLLDLETRLVQQMCAQIASAGEELLTAAAAIASLDCLAALAEAAVRYGYVRPQLDSDDKVQIEGGRHPVVERMLEDTSFVPNDTQLAGRDAQILILTGPNMSGKSTYLRQVALIVLMAQVGSFVPAAAAHIGLVDQIFSRIGAQDDLASGQSTFMIEMVETANILHHVTPRSLVILDEIGRGTSTYDGLSIAQAVVEYLHNAPNANAKTLFATHYHELTALSRSLPRVRNYTFAVAEEEGQAVFLRRILPGGADKSYGIHVARLAGLPPAVTQRAQQVLEDLESTPAPKARRRTEPSQQLPLLDGHSPLVDDLAGLELDAMSPLEALNRLYQLQQQAKKERTPER